MKNKRGRIVSKKKHFSEKVQETEGVQALHQVQQPHKRAGRPTPERRNQEVDIPND
jgi:hypothetical protein